jgi:hypothetical protein
MESNILTEKEKKEERSIQDTYNDEYWSKKYNVSPTELKKTGKDGISAKIIEASIRNKSFSL